MLPLNTAISISAKEMSQSYHVQWQELILFEKKKKLYLAPEHSQKLEPLVLLGVCEVIKPIPFFHWLESKV